MAVRRAASAVLAAAVLAGVAALLLAGGDGAQTKAAPAVAPSAVSGEQVPRGLTRRDGGTLAARLRRPVVLRERPGGRVVRSLGRRTEFGSERVLAVVAQRPGWLGVLTEHLPNSRAGWIPISAVELLVAPYTLHVDLSARTLVVRRERRVARRITVAVGRPGTATPTGRFAVTDTLEVGAGSPYGCCALALTGRQPNIPQGWTGGDRLAIHGTTNEGTLGRPASSGCLRASDRDMRWLMANVAPGSRVQVRA
ncbi:MAG: L,D-transpeptidase [Actinobacteria bacterium]|nr:L,D-transpeptidase [Actinomycetota bacterium]